MLMVILGCFCETILCKIARESSSTIISLSDVGTCTIVLNYCTLVGFLSVLGLWWVNLFSPAASQVSPQKVLMTQYSLAEVLIIEWQRPNHIRTRARFTQSAQTCSKVPGCRVVRTDVRITAKPADLPPMDAIIAFYCNAGNRIDFTDRYSYITLDNLEGENRNQN